MYARLQLVTPALAQVTRGGDRAANAAARASAPSKIANSSTSMRAATSAVLSVRSSSEVQGVEASDSRATRNQSSHPRSSFPDALTSVSPSDILRSRCVVIHFVVLCDGWILLFVRFLPRLKCCICCSDGDVSPSPASAHDVSASAVAPTHERAESSAVVSAVLAEVLASSPASADTSVDSHSSASPEEHIASRRGASKLSAHKARDPPRSAILVFDSGDIGPSVAKPTSSRHVEEAAVVPTDANTAEALSLSPVSSSAAAPHAASHGPVAAKPMGVAESLRRLQNTRPLSSPLRCPFVFGFCRFAVQYYAATSSRMSQLSIIRNFSFATDLLSVSVPRAPPHTHTHV